MLHLQEIWRADGQGDSIIPSPKLFAEGIKLI